MNEYSVWYTGGLVLGGVFIGILCSGYISRRLCGGCLCYINC